MQRAKGQSKSPRAASAHRVAVLIPCYNEAATIAQVVGDFHAALPGAVVYVYDNNSTDGTGEAASAAGAVVVRETRQGKGHVVRRMFRDIDADVFVLVDGDATYDAASLPKLIGELAAGADMVVAARVSQDSAAYRRGHQFGNRTLTGFVAAVFGKELRDMLSGYRVMSRRFVKSFPALSTGFEIETELTVHALAQRLPTSEMRTPYFERLAGSQSKLSTYRDGLRILRMTVSLYRDERPLSFFGMFAIAFAAAGLILGGSVVVEYMETHLVLRFPTAILATGLMLLSFLSLACGLILHNVARGQREMKRLAYLAAGVDDAQRPRQATQPAAGPSYTHVR